MNQTRRLLLSALLVWGCASIAPPLARAEATAEGAPSGEPLLELALASPQSLGAAVVVSLTNVGQVDHVEPLDAEGCRVPGVKMHLVSEDGAFIRLREREDDCEGTFADGQLTVSAGAQVQLMTLDTGARVYREATSGDVEWMPHRLEPGWYTVVVETSVGAVEGELLLEQ